MNLRLVPGSRRWSAGCSAIDTRWGRGEPGDVFRSAAVHRPPPGCRRGPRPGSCRQPW